MTDYNQRYVFVTAECPDPRTGGGTAVAVLGLMEALHHKGKRIGLVSPPHLPLPVAWSRWWFNVNVPRELAHLDVDRVIGVDCDAHRYASLPGRRPFVALLHGVKADEVGYEDGAFKRRLRREARWEHRAARAADLVVVPSEYARERAAALYHLDAARVCVVPNGLDFDRWPAQPEPEGLPPTVFCASQLLGRKHLGVLLEALPGVLKEVPDARLRIAGKGPERNRLSALAGRLGLTPEQVQFLGPLHPSRVRVELADSHVFCLPSVQEAFGLSILEAMATGRAVVAARAGAIPEVIGDTGVLVPPGRPAELATALIELLLSPGARRDLAIRARTRAESFTWNEAARRFIETMGRI